MKRITRVLRCWLFGHVYRTGDTKTTTTGGFHLFENQCYRCNESERWWCHQSAFFTKDDLEAARKWSEENMSI